MEAQQKIDLLWERFVHRSDTYAEQWFDPERGGGYGRKKHGKCKHDPPCARQGKDCPDIRYVALTKSTLVEHLKGETTVGTYALDDRNTVRWLCLDIDVRKDEDGDVQALTLDVARFMLRYLPRTAFLVEYSGSRGYHIWIFFSEPVSAAKAYSLGAWIRAYTPHSPSLGIEIYPKQVSATRVGNPVKIPLGIHRKTGKRCMFVKGDFTEHEDQWAALADVIPLTLNELTSIMEVNTIEEVELATPSTATTKRGMPCMTRIMEEGLEEGARDVGFFRLALYLKDRGLPYEHTLAVMEVTNQHCSPPFNELEMKAQSAYDGNYSVFPCYDPTFDPYCSSTCVFYAKKVKDRGYGDENIVKQLSRD